MLQSEIFMLYGPSNHKRRVFSVTHIRTSLPFMMLQSSGFLTMRRVVQHGAAVHFDQSKQCLPSELLIAKVSENMGWPHHAKWPILPLCLHSYFLSLWQRMWMQGRPQRVLGMHMCVWVCLGREGLGGTRWRNMHFCANRRRTMTKFDLLNF